MKKALLFTLLTLAVSISALADDDRHQSYISYDDGGTVVRSGEDGREIDAHRNLPIYPGDEVITARRGRAEIRLSDGNIVGIDRTTAIVFRSIRDSYEGEGSETVAELRHGKVAVHRTDIGRDYVRLDTSNASYVAEREAIYSVETESNGRDRVTVFDGTIELRTPNRTTRLREGESVTVDDRGLYDLVGDQRAASDDFERWFLRRADRFENYNSRYVDRRLGYWADDLDDHGRWVFLTGIGWSWRPYVAVGWRPYHHGYWHHGRGGFLTWVSYDPWAWGTYHYGRWAFDPGYGWVWVPGYGYSPAWVYWSYGPGYVGWAPAGWWDCYRPYYNWAYHPYRHRGIGSYGFGFYGRVRVNEFDLRPWTFVDSGTLISNRADRAALATEAIKQRLSRSRDGFATIGGGAARFTREELRDPAEAIRRRGIDGRHTGRETGAPNQDITPFIRRDAEVGGAIRDRIIKARGGSPSTGTGGATAGPSRNLGGGGSATTPSTGTIDRRGGNLGGGINRGGSRTPADKPAETPRVIGGGGVVDRGGAGSTDRGERDRIDRDRTDRGDAANRGDGANRGGDWRSRIGGGDRQATPPATSSPSDETPPGRNDSWRSRVRSDADQPDQPRATTPSSGDRGSSSSDVPRRVIDRIGGARVVPRDSDSGSSTRDRSSATRDSGSRDRGSVRDSGGSRSSGSRQTARPSQPRSDSRGGSRETARPSQPRSDSGGGSSTRSSGSNNSGGSRGDSDGGGRVKRDQ